jgi:hypothetical protein
VRSFSIDICGTPVNERDMSSLFIGSVKKTVHKLFILSSLLTSPDSSVGIATGYGLDDRRVGVRVPVRSRISSAPRRPDRLWGPTEPFIQWVPAALSPGVKLPGGETDHSTPTITFTPPSVFMA